uniref:Uncharacterized protein n=1 Tax=Mastacembelus armatus TaxID=205130 RepID=A0A7N8XV69_9TELE
SWSSCRFSPASQSHRVIDLDRKNAKLIVLYLQVLDVGGNDVTPRPLYHAEPGEMPARFFLEEIFRSSRSEQSTVMTLFCRSFMCSRWSSSLSNIESLTETEDRSSKLDMSLNLPSLCENEHLPLDAMLNEVVDILDGSSDWEKNINYAELCKNRMGNDKFIERSTQTLTGAPKNKQVQTDKIVMVDEGLS